MFGNALIRSCEVCEVQDNGAVCFAVQSVRRVDKELSLLQHRGVWDNIGIGIQQGMDVSAVMGCVEAYAWFRGIIDNISIQVQHVRPALVPTVSLTEGFIDVVDQVFVG